MSPVAVELLRRGCEHGESPPAGSRDPGHLPEQRVELSLIADGISAHERAAGDDAIREERASTGREQVALVAAEREEREAVVTVCVDERPCRSSLSDGLRNGERERTQPEV